MSSEAFETTIDRIVTIIEYYRDNDPDGDTLVELMRKLSTRLAYLETERSEIHKKWTAHVGAMTREGSSVAAAERSADETFEEMYKLRRIMEGGYRVLDVMRSHLSFMKTEMTAINQ